MDYILLFFAVLIISSLIAVLIIFNIRMFHLRKATNNYFKSLKKFKDELNK